MRTVLVVEDDLDMQMPIRLGLEEGGFRVFASQDGPSAVESMHAHGPDLILIDVNLGPDSFDGFELCRRIRTNSNVPVIFLSVRGDDVDQLVGLAVGGDDYLVKPISSRVLCARIHIAIERSHQPPRRSRMIVEGDVEVDTESRVVRVRGSIVDLTRIEFDLLANLASSPDRVLTRQYLTSSVWGEWFGSDAHLDVHMSRLRKKILDAGGPRVGECVRGVGFRLH